MKKMIECDTCGGEKYIGPLIDDLSLDRAIVYMKCPMCNEDGKIPDPPNDFTGLDAIITDDGGHTAAR